eukprot:8260353-Heterocapsa_arctica.AAC.1
MMLCLQSVVQVRHSHFRIRTSWLSPLVDCVDHVNDLVALTNNFAGDTGPKDNVLKSRRFGTTPDIRRFLGGRPGPKVSD